ncbi:geranylgeranylglyceryl/heptaprenylglyceryl phosphate synthase [Aureitalea marina]|uniref:Geranylgeranylglyceryl phosphate synthase n=1 Tax=Aureitalea marina TaxID=930804 RepID=A0A2S7KT58_9FLAO|nr:geranylgeranylglyceryl/heptaprenylglyceryl phosphate synthase [Aureitalea marina]PQB05796.1 geranylgeranylglyceryl/heptaprenylglyceryl phosphate synthase [Aureitalea marina]
MQVGDHYKHLLQQLANQKELLGILIDPDKFDLDRTEEYIDRLPKGATHILVGGSTVKNGQTDLAVQAIRQCTQLPVWLFPGDHHQISERADVLMFLSLLSGRNPEYLIGQQLKAAAHLKDTSLEVIPTAYILVDGGHRSAVQQVTGTLPMPQEDVEEITHTALAGQLMGASMVYLEAGSGAITPVRPQVIQAVQEVLDVPLIVGGGIRSQETLRQTYKAGANMVIMGTHFETPS